MTTSHARLHQHLRPALGRYLAALRAGTRLPVDRALPRWDAGAHDPAAGAAHDPGVGLLVGLIACVAFAVAALPLPDSAAGGLVAAVLSTLASLALTGALHEQGLARTVRHLAPGDAATMVTGLVLVLKVALLAMLAGESAAGVLAALPAAHAVSRFWPLVLRHAIPCAGDDGALLQPPAQRGGLLVGALWCLPALLLLLAAGGVACVLAALLASGLVFVALVRRYRPRLQAVTRDGLGAVQQVCEVAFYLGAGLILRA